MNNQELARLMADHNYRIPVHRVELKGMLGIYEFSPEFDELFTETWNQPNRATRIKRREVFDHHGGWGAPGGIWRDKATGRCRLVVLLYPGRRIPGPGVPVLVKFGKRPNSAAMPYRAEYLYRAGKEPVLAPPGPKERDRARREEVRAEKISENEKRRYKRTSRRLGEIQC